MSAQRGGASVVTASESPPAPDGQVEMTQALSRVRADLPLAVAASIGPLRRERATAPFIERILHAPQLASASAWLPECARTLGDRAEWIVVGFSDVLAVDPSLAIANGPWTRREALECARDQEQIEIRGEHTIEVRAPSLGERTSPLLASALPQGMTIRARVWVVLDRLSAEVVFTARTEQDAIATEAVLRTHLADVLAKPTLGMGSLVIYRSGSRVTATLDAGPTMLGVIESALP